MGFLSPFVKKNRFLRGKPSLPFSFVCVPCVCVERKREEESKGRKQGFEDSVDFEGFRSYNSGIIFSLVCSLVEVFSSPLMEFVRKARDL
jgi:hypothetical protein